MPRKLPSPTQFVGLVLGLLVAGAIYGHPQARAWWQFPAMTEAQLRASLESAARFHSTFPAFDSRGNEVQVLPERLLSGEPGACQRWYSRSDSDNSRRMPILVGGVATFDCLFHLQVEGHGPLRAVVQTMFFTDPPPQYRPEGRALHADPGLAILARLEARLPAGR